MPETEMIDRLFLELSQFTNATTGKERMFQAELAAAQAEIARLRQKLADIEQENYDRMAEKPQ